MSVAGLCVVYISGWVWSGEVAEPIGSGVPVRGGQQVVAGEGVYKCGAVGNYCCVLEGCLFPLSLPKKE